MVENFNMIKGIRDDSGFRRSFNELALHTFGIQFEEWYQAQFWTEKYQPYSILDKDKVIANVSVNKLELMIDGVKRRAIQIGTVMTHPDYRKQGHAARLMNKVLEEYEDESDIMYLFANQSVLDFYPKYGFEPVVETQFTMKYSGSRRRSEFQRLLDGSSKKDLQFIYQFVTERVPISSIFGAIGSAELVMFYCMYVFSKNIYFLDKENAIVLCEQEEDQLHLYDIISKDAMDLEAILDQVCTPETKEIVFHFTPESNNLPIRKEIFQGSEVLYVKTKGNIELPKYFKHPLTSQA
jgi:GNAT superfamily N-acetyltransferase